MERKWWTLLALCIASFMLMVDVTIVNVALPSIQRDLHASLTDLQWVIDAYALVLAGLILTAGTLADRFGRRLVFAVGVAIFIVASLICGLAGSATVLALARAAQGLGGAAMFATALALIGQEFRGADRGVAFAVWGATVGLGVAAGPLLGGVLTEGLGWGWIFFVNVPVGLLPLAVARLRMAEWKTPNPGPLDFGGLVTFSLGLFAFVFALLRGNGDGWGSAQIVGPLVASAVLLTAFVFIERRHSHPMFDLSLLRKPAFAGVSIGTLAIAAGMFSMFAYISIYLQDVLGYGPLKAGLQFMPVSAFVFAVPLATRRLTAGLPPRIPLVGGLALVSLGLLLMSGLNTRSDWTVLLPGMIVAGVGIGLANPAIGAIALAVVEPARAGMASGISNTCRLAGVAVGIAGLGALLERRVTSDLGTQLHHAPGNLGALVASAGTRPLGHSGPLVNAARHAFVAGMYELFLVAAGCLALGAIAALFVRRADFHSPVPAAAAA